MQNYHNNSKTSGERIDKKRNCKLTSYRPKNSYYILDTKCFYVIDFV